MTLVWTAVLIVGAAPAHGAAKPITGDLSKGGQTVIALSSNGEATTAKAKSNGKFKLRPPEKSVTLQLREKSGKYGGPIVVGEKGKKAIVGVKAGAELGKLKLRRGYAEATEELSPKSSLDAKRLAKARKGAPIGNGRNFGLVRTSAPGSTESGEDQDQDGVPNALDVDEDGDEILNPLDTDQGSARAQAAQEGPPPAGPEEPAPGGGGTGDTEPAPAGPDYAYMSQLFLDVDTTVNANASGISQAQLDQTLVDNLNVKLPNVPDADLVELDCGGLVYCSLGGTGKVATGEQPGGGAGGGPTPITEPFPSCCDPDGNGFGSIVGPGAPEVTPSQFIRAGEFSLYPRATSEQIGSGDTTILRVTQGGELSETPDPIAFVFYTVPALAVYDDGTGAKAMSYPTTTGAQTNPIPVSANADGDVVMTFSFWRPQRLGIPGAGEPEIMDIGQLAYSVNVAPQQLGPENSIPAGGGSPACPASTLSTSDPNLSPQPEGSVPTPGGQPGELLVDGTQDQPADPANTLTFTVNLTDCIQAKGGSGWESSERLLVDIAANALESPDHANQKIWLTRQG